LTPQAAITPGPAWDALQISAGDGSSLIIHAFQNDPASRWQTIAPYGLDPTATYDVQSLDTGPIGAFTGDELMNDGVSLTAWPESAAHILLLTRRAAQEQARRK
jgi:hypothetical protein